MPETLLLCGHLTLGSKEARVGRKGPASDLMELPCRVCRTPLLPETERCPNCGSLVIAPKTSGSGFPHAMEPSAGVHSPALFQPVRRPGISKLWLLWMATSVASLGIASYFFMQNGVTTQAPSVEVAPAPSADVESLEIVELPVAQPETPEPAEPTPAPEPPSEPTTPAPEPFVIEWRGTAQAVQGGQVRRASKCSLQVAIHGVDSDGDARRESVKVSCADQVLYDSRTPLNGMAMMSSELFELPDPKGGWAYEFHYSDTGARSGRTQLTVDPASQEVTVFSEQAPTFRVQIRLNQSRSVVREGLPLFETPRTVMPLNLSLSVETQEGPAPIDEGAKCQLNSVFEKRTSTAAICKTTLSCGKQTLYGGKSTGYGPCRLKGEQVFAFTDSEPSFSDKDPAFSFDLDESTFLLSDTPDAELYTVKFTE